MLWRFWNPKKEIADAVLDAEVKIGELLASVPKAEFVRDDDGRFTAEPSEKQQARSDIGISLQQAKRFQTLAKHPDAVEQAKEDARRNERKANERGKANQGTRTDICSDLNESVDAKAEASEAIGVSN